MSSPATEGQQLPPPPPQAEGGSESVNYQDVRRRVSRSSQEFLETFSFWRLLDPTEPWVLVENGSFMGHFDWVPKQYRVGPWSTAAQCYMAVLFYVAALAAAYLASDISRPWWPIDFADSNALEYPPVFSNGWYYNALAGAWMLFVMIKIMTAPLSYRAWSTYTVQSWTLLWLRHVLCALAPTAPWAAQWAEYIRFPAACSTTCTFVIWNGVVIPYAYWIGLKTEQERRNFWDFAFSFRLVQIHFFNIVFCVLNGVYASPRRQLEYVDLALAVFSAMAYMAWYLFVLDRIGIHIYPVFSPRVWWTVIPMWTFLLLTYVATFFVWRAVLKPV